MLDPGLRPSRSAYFGIGLLSFVLLGSQLVLTRIFSVTLWYHFAFLVVSLVMLGMAAGGSLVYALPRWFTPKTVLRRVALLSAGSGVLLFAAIIIVLGMPPNLGGPVVTQAGTIRAALITLSLLPSFILAGIAIAALFQSFPEAFPGLYASDLLGAGLGAVAVLWLMWQLSGPSLGLLMGSLLVGSGAFFAASGGHVRLRTQLALGCALLFSASLVNESADLVRVRHTKNFSREQVAKSAAKANVIHERWSPIAHLVVFDNYIFASTWRKAFVGWGVGSKYSGTPPLNYHFLQDAQGGTMLTLWDGDMTKLSHLDYDVTAFPFHLRRFDSVLIVGPGGGRDVLTALRGKATEIVAVDMNPDIIDLMTNELLDASGGLYLRPEVEPVAAEARSWLTRSSRSFDVIQLSMVDTLAATAAGALAFAENNLYTVEAFELYLDHLRDGGVLSISRWFAPIEVPGQALKVVSIAAEALRRRGVEDPSQYVIGVRGGLLGTVLVSNRPFSSEDHEAAVKAAERYGLDLVYIPGDANNHAEFAKMLAPGNMQSYLTAHPLDLRPVDDDRPFFFILSRGLFSLDARDSSYQMGLNLLAWLIGGMTVLGALLVIGPLVLRTRVDGALAAKFFGSVRPLLYFAGLGAGFMLVEITLLQRFIVYLGHPTYAATIVLTTLLISLGLGSAMVGRQPMATSLARQRWLAALGMAIVLAVALVGPAITGSTQGAPLLLRIGLAAVMLIAVGVPLGTLLPTGMRRLIATGLDPLIPWAWAVNGVAGVVFSAMALMLAIHWGYTVCLLIGVGFYVLSLITIPARGPIGAIAGDGG